MDGAGTWAMLWRLMLPIAAPMVGIIAIIGFQSMWIELPFSILLLQRAELRTVTRVPDFMNSRPSTELYVRWTQVGVFTSHLRYHGAQPREPYEYPEAAPVVREWLKLRYALIPYLAAQAEKAVRTGLPIFRALAFHHADDPMAWHIDDQFYCGDSFLAAPVLNAQGVRDVYLPAGEWVDLWSGETLTDRGDYAHRSGLARAPRPGR